RESAPGLPRCDIAAEFTPPINEAATNGIDRQLKEADLLRDRRIPFVEKCLHPDILRSVTLCERTKVTTVDCASVRECHPTCGPRQHGVAGSAADRMGIDWAGVLAPESPECVPAPRRATCAAAAQPTLAAS